MIYEFSTVILKIPNVFFIEISNNNNNNKSNLKYIRKHKIPNSQSNQSRKNNTSGITMTLKLYWRFIVTKLHVAGTKTDMYFNKIEREREPGDNLHIHSHPIVDKCVKIYTKWKIVSSTNVTGKAGYLHVDEWKQIPISHHVQKLIQSGWKALI